MPSRSTKGAQKCCENALSRLACTLHQCFRASADTRPVRRRLAYVPSTSQDNCACISLHHLDDVVYAGAAAGQHAALVQGASRGLGLEFVRQLLAEEAPGGRGGGLVVATCRDPANAEELRMLAAKHPSRLHVVPLDVTQQATIDVRDRSHSLTRSS